MQRSDGVVYWVIARVSPPEPEPGTGRTVERLGPFDSQRTAEQARDAAASRYRQQPRARVEIVCDFS